MVPYDATSGVWDDQLHLSPAGYALLAERIVAELIAIGLVAAPDDLDAAVSVQENITCPAGDSKEARRWLGAYGPYTFAEFVEYYSGDLMAILWDVATLDHPLIKSRARKSGWQPGGRRRQKMGPSGKPVGTL